MIQAYNPGPFRTFWKMRYSDDTCFKRYPGWANTNMTIEFCERMGGKLPGGWVCMHTRYRKVR